MYFFREFIGNYNDYYYNTNGHFYLWRILQQRCNCSEKDLEFIENPIEQCKGFNLYPKNYFYAIDWQEWAMAFEPVNHEMTITFMDLVKKSYMIHMTDSMSKEVKARKNTNCAYERLAKKFCPKVYSLIEDEF